MEVLADTPTQGRVAVVRALQLGDMLCAAPALRSLRAALPKARITLIGLPWAREFVARYSDYLDDFLEFPGFPGIPEQSFEPDRTVAFLAQHSKRFDLAIQLHGSGPNINPFTQLLGARRTAGFYLPGDTCPDAASFLPWPEQGHEIQRLSSLICFLGAPDCGDKLEFPLSPEDWAEAQTLMQTHGLSDGQFVCLHPGGRMLSRRWSLDKFAEVAAWLHGTGYRVVLTGAPFEAPLAHALAERMTCPFVNVAGQTSVGGMAGLLKHARLLVSNDTGVSHIAAGLQVPSVVIVLGSQPDRWAPLNAELHRTVMHPIDCRPCSHFECPIGFGCEQRVTVEQVIRTIRNILGVEPTDSGASFMSMSSSVPPSPTLTPATPLIASTEVLPLDWVPPIDAESDRKERCRAIESVA